MDKVSVIVPVYNVAPWLKRCIDALIGQTYSNLEILLIDDGSTDGSREIIAQSAAEDVRIRPFYQPHNQGVSAARNRGLDEASGEWIAFCDGDDWYLPEFVETMLRCAKSEQADYIVCDYQIVSDKGLAIVACSTAGVESGIDRRKVIACGPTSSCTHLIRRELFLLSGVRYPIGCRQYEELSVIPVLAKYAARIGVVHKPLYCYYQRGNGTSASNAQSSSVQSFLSAADAMRTALGKDYRAEVEYHAIYALFYGEILRLCKCKSSTAQIKEQIIGYERRYPMYWKNAYLAHMGLAKRVFLWLERRRWIWGLRILANIHASIIR